MSSRMRQCCVASVFSLAIVGFAAGCATMNVNSYTERGVDLRQYRSYNWAAPDTTSTGDPRLDNNRFFDERVRAEVEKELGRRGFEKSATPDLLVHYHASVSQEIDVRELDGSPSYCADHDCRPYIYDKGTLFVDLAEPRTDRLLWRGWAEGSIDGVIDNQAWLEARIDQAVNKILTRLPNGLLH